MSPTRSGSGKKAVGPVPTGHETRNQPLDPTDIRWDPADWEGYRGLLRGFGRFGMCFGKIGVVHGEANQAFGAIPARRLFEALLQ